LTKEVMTVPTETLIKREHVAPPPSTPEQDAFHDAARKQAKRVRRLKINAVAWAAGATLLTALWVYNQWNANGAFRHFGFEGNPGDWSPTLWALGVGLWGLIVGIMALRVHFERPVTRAEAGSETERSKLERARRLQFHVAAWALGMIVLLPLWALIEWQDNGGFERWSNNSRPGDWDPWILTVGGIWALGIVILALRLRFDRPKPTPRS
jgi:hypothetical protein